MRVPGIGPKTAKRVFSELDIRPSMRCWWPPAMGASAALAGLGDNTEQAILAGLQVPREHKRDRVASGRLRPFAERVAADLRELGDVEECEIAGSLRRFTETAKDIDLVVATRRPAAVGDALAASEWVAEVESRGDAKLTCIAHDGTRVELRMIEPEVFGNLLQHLTGSKHHNVALREAAVRAGLKVSEYGIEQVETGEVLHCREEAEVYERLGMDWIPPELRENRGEIEAARNAGVAGTGDGRPDPR